MHCYSCFTSLLPPTVNEHKQYFNWFIVTYKKHYFQYYIFQEKYSTQCTLWKIKHSSALSYCMASYDKHGGWGSGMWLHHTIMIIPVKWYRRTDMTNEDESAYESNHAMINNEVVGPGISVWVYTSLTTSHRHSWETVLRWLSRWRLVVYCLFQTSTCECSQARSVASFYCQTY